MWRPSGATRVIPALLIALAIASPDAGAQDVNVRASVGYDRSLDARFVDRSCNVAPLLNFFGCLPGADGAQIGAAGDFGGTVTVEIATGIRVWRFFRAEFAASHRPGSTFSGNATFLGAGDQQPVGADLTATTLMARGYVDVTTLLARGPLEPFVAAAIGRARLRTGSVTYAFPELAAQPATTTTPGGVHWQRAWDVGAGTAVRLWPRTVIEGGYRYSDLGWAESADGPIEVVRGDRVRLIGDVAGTRARVRSHGIYVGVRHEF